LRSCSNNESLSRDFQTKGLTRSLRGSPVLLCRLHDEIKKLIDEIKKLQLRADFPPLGNGGFGRHSHLTTCPARDYVGIDGERIQNDLSLQSMQDDYNKHTLAKLPVVYPPEHIMSSDTQLGFVATATLIASAQRGQRGESNDSPLLNIHQKDDGWVKP